MHGKLLVGAAIFAFSLGPVAADVVQTTDVARGQPAGSRVTKRLPPHFSKIVDKPQREKIYAIQSKYAEKIAALQDQLKDLTLKRDREIRDVLTSEQQQQLDELLAAARAKSKASKKQADTRKIDPEKDSEKDSDEKAHSEQDTTESEIPESATVSPKN